MKRIVLVSLVALTACDPVVLEKYPRPFACDHNGGDGGVQCAKNWECGFDDRCFPKDLVEDGGFKISEWECETDKHCPDDWQCGVEVNDERHCQQLGVGAPSPCLLTDGGLDAGGCQGGWRCGADDKCFNPAISDGGTTRECTVNEQCPLNFSCGELVKDRGQHCIDDRADGGAPSDCNTDDGCRGNRRCDTVNHVCVQVTDVIATGGTGTIGATELSPRHHEQSPVFFAMTRTVRLENLDDLGSTVPREGVLMASVLNDGGLRVTAQFRDEIRVSGQQVKSLLEKTYPLPGGLFDVTDLAVSSDSAAVRFRDGGVSLLSLGDGGWFTLTGRIDNIRQRESFAPNQSTGLIFTSGNQVLLGPPGLPFDAGVISFDGGVNEVVAAREGLYVLTTAGTFFVGDGGAIVPLAPSPMSGPMALASRSKGAVAAYIGGPGPQARLSIFAEQPRAGGGTAVFNLTNSPMVQFWDATPVFQACPDGGVSRQLSIDLDQASNQALYSHCVDSQGGTFPITINNQGNGQLAFRAVVEDQIPFQQGLVNQYASPFVRAHAGSNGRGWHAIDTTERGLLGSLPLRPVQLDRQPETMISFRDDSTGTIRVYAQSNGHVFTNDLLGGFISQLAPSPIAPLSIITSRNWIVGNGGLLDAQGGEPRLIGTLPAGEQFSAPATGVTVKFPTLEGGLRDVVLVASADSLWLADVTDALAGEFAQPAVFARVLVPVPGVPLRSMMLSPSDGGSIAGYLTTNTTNVSFSTTDLIRWSVGPVATPSQLNALPLEVWGEADGGAGRTGFSDGRIWSLPIMVPLTQKLLASDGGTQLVSDYGRKCGDVFAVSSQGLFRAQASGVDGGLPSWSRVTPPVALDSTESLKLFETKDPSGDRLFVGTRTGQVLELTGSCP